MKIAFRAFTFDCSSWAGRFLEIGHRAPSEGYQIPAIADHPGGRCALPTAAPPPRFRRLNRKAKYNLDKDLKDKFDAFLIDDKMAALTNHSNGPRLNTEAARIEPK